MYTMILHVSYRMAPANAIVPNCGPSAYLMLRDVVPCGVAAMEAAADAVARASKSSKSAQI